MAKRPPQDRAILKDIKARLLENGDTDIIELMNHDGTLCTHLIQLNYKKLAEIRAAATAWSTAIHRMRLSLIGPRRERVISKTA